MIVFSFSTVASKSSFVSLSLSLSLSSLSLSLFLVGVLQSQVFYLSCVGMHEHLELSMCASQV